MSENIRESLEKLSKVGTEDEQLLPRVLLRVLDDFDELKNEIGEVKAETGKVKTGIGEVNSEIKTEISEARTAQRKEIRIVGICTVIIISLVVFAGIFWLSGQ